MKRSITIFAAALAMLGAIPAARAATGAELLKSQCVSCHAIARPQDDGVQRLYARKGPDLEYAGAKFNRDWLVAWLQSPTVIRPGGVMYSTVVKAGEAGSPDRIDTSKLTPHPRLSAQDAAAAADALMALGTSDGVVAKGAYKGEPGNAAMASLLFNKLRGCASCHSGKPGSGGQSAPELYTAGARLQPDYIVEYVRDPQKFDAHVWMPRLELTDADVQKLTGYLLTLKQGATQ